jgi:hypothetical protein
LSRQEVIVLTVIAEQSIEARWVSETEVLEGTAKNALHQAKAMLGLKLLEKKKILIGRMPVFQLGGRYFRYRITAHGWEAFGTIADNLTLKPTAERK